MMFKYFLDNYIIYFKGKILDFQTSLKIKYWHFTGEMKFLVLSNSKISLLKIERQKLYDICSNISSNFHTFSYSFFLENPF